MEENRGNRLAALDGLRGIAILLVFWFHIWQLSWLPPIAHLGPLTFDASFLVRSGFLGVDLFFFLSGFCLFYPYAQAHFDGKPRPGLAHFAYRRAVKILPSYITACAGALFLGYGSLSLPKDALSLIRMHALFFLPDFPTEIASISGVLWSLGVEIQFYILFPLIAWCLQRQAVATVVCAILLASFDRVGVLRLHGQPPYRFMEQLPACIDFFVSGMFAAYAYRLLAVRQKGKPPKTWMWTLLAAGGSALFLYTAGYIYGKATNTENWPYPTFPVAFPLLDIAFICITLGSLRGTRLWQRMLANPPLLFLACISYNLYLWHQIIAFEIFHHDLVPHHGADPREDGTWQTHFTAIAACAALIVAAAFTFGLERPLLHARRAGEKKSERQRQPPTPYT
jgi:peptidoglycan/LPS O-acetylase OafA/YrhL